MMRTLPVLASAGLVAVGLVLTTPAPGGAAPAPAPRVAHPVQARAGTSVTIGRLAPNPNAAGTCTSYTLVQASTVTPGQYVVPFAGVVTSFSYAAKTAVGGQVRPVFFVPAGGNNFTQVAKGVLSTAPAGVVSTFPARIPVPAGALLGMQTVNASSMACADPSASDVIDYNIGYNPDTTTAFAGTPDAYLLDISAVVETDADGDGYGDVTQDLCPQSATTQATCPAPDTKVKKPKLLGINKVQFKFKSSIPGSTFTCAIDSNNFVPCASPLKKKFAFGKHVILVAAVSPLGIADPTPFKGKFKLVRP